LISTASILGILMYSRFLTKINLKKILIISTILWSLVYSINILLVTGAYKQMGISDKAMAIISNIFNSFLGEVHLMPIMVLACRICPKHVEASVYSFIMTSINVSYLISYQLGGLFTWALGITATDFTNLWALVLISILFPLFFLPFLACTPISIDLNKDIKISEEENRVKVVGKT